MKTVTQLFLMQRFSKLGITAPTTVIKVLHDEEQLAHSCEAGSSPCTESFNGTLKDIERRALMVDARLRLGEVVK